MAALLGGEARDLTESELERIARFVSEAKAVQRGPGHSADAPRSDGSDANDESGEPGRR